MKKEFYKKNEIIVRTKISDSWSTVKPGKMYKIPFDQHSSGNVTISGGWMIYKDCFRRATEMEVDAFHSGIKNINDIPKSEDNYSLF